MDVSNVSNVSEAVVIHEHRHQRRIIRRRERQRVIELMNKSSTHLDVIESITENNSQQIRNIIATLQQQNRKLLFKKQPDKSGADSQNHISLEKKNITDDYGNIQNVSASPSIITQNVSQEHNVEYLKFDEDSSPDSLPLFLDQTDNYGVQNVENNVYTVNNNSHYTGNSKGPQFKRKRTKVSDDNRLTHNDFEKPTKQNIPDQTSVASNTSTTNSNFSQQISTASPTNRSKRTTSYSKYQNLDDKLKQYACKSIKSAVYHEMVCQRRPNVDFPSEYCMNATIAQPKYDSCGIEKESIYEDVIPVTLNDENCLPETCSNLSFRDEDESCFSDENSLTSVKHRSTQPPETKDKDSKCDKTCDKGHRNYDRRSTGADSYTKQGYTARCIQMETSSSGYCTASRQLQVGTCGQEARDENKSCTRNSQTSVATVTSEEKVLPNASNEVKQCDMTEHQSIQDDTTMDEEEMLYEEKVVELIKENERLQRITKKMTRKRMLKERMAELENSNSELFKQIEKEKIRISRGETTTVYERIGVDRKKDVVERSFHLIPPDYIFEYHDVLILYNSDNDHDEAEKFKLHLQNDFKLSNGGKVKAALYDGPEMDTGTNLKFEHLEKSFERCTLKFIFLTSSFLKNDWANVCKESFICEAMYMKEYRSSIVPIHAHGKIKAPMGLNSLSGFRYYNRDNNYEKRMLKLLEKNSYKREEKERALIKIQYDLVLSILEK